MVTVTVEVAVTVIVVVGVIGIVGVIVIVDVISSVAWVGSGEGVSKVGFKPGACGEAGGFIGVGKGVPWFSKKALDEEILSHNNPKNKTDTARRNFSLFDAISDSISKMRNS
jgi:hypothetical protein